LENTRRARSKVRRLVRAYDLTRLLTFTNGSHDSEGFDTRSAALDAYYGFDRYCRDLLGNTPRLVVAERGGKRGRWHIHVLIRRGYRIPYRGIIRAWSAHMERLGYHSATGIHRFHAGDEFGKHKDGFTSSRVAANYAAKYLGKHADDDARISGEHRYRSYNAAAPLPVVTRHADLGAAMSDLRDMVRVYPLAYVNGETGEEHIYGYLFDGGG
jgi:hypothetical protein